MDKLFYGRINGIYLISYVCLIRFLLALNFVFVKTKMFNPLSAKCCPHIETLILKEPGHDGKTVVID